MSTITITVDAWVDEFTREDTMRQWLEGVARNGFPCELKTGDRRYQTLDVQVRAVVPDDPGRRAFAQYYRNAGQEPANWDEQDDNVRTGWEAIASAVLGGERKPKS